MFDHCAARIALSWNDNVAFAHCIAFAGERERGRTQCDFAPKNAINFVSKLDIFQKVKSDTGENLGWPRTEVYISSQIKSHPIQIVFEP